LFNGPLNGPDIALFKQFLKSWPNINQEAFKNGLMSTFISPNLNVLKTYIVKFIFDKSTEFQPRDDYKELLQLNLYFFGEEFLEKNGFGKPRACHRARWMAKIIYSFTI